jgi:NTE family protein
MKNKAFFCTVIGFLILLLTSCGTFPKNPDLAKYEPKVGYRYDNLESGDNNTNSLFVILAFSGGGTRAASLSYGVLQELGNTQIEWKGQTKRLLDEVDIISSVSGGSFTSAYYTLNRDKIFDGTFEKKFLKANIEKKLKSQLFKPSNWFNLIGTSYGRSDLAADYWDNYLFNHATFQSLLDKGSRPFLMLNATDMGTGGQFLFIQDQMDLICSDLSELPIARAVAASSAFPGLLTPLTLENYAGTCSYEPSVWVSRRLKHRKKAPQKAETAELRQSYYLKNEPGIQRDYIHLVDGGVADNIGLRSVLHAMNSPEPSYSIQRMINNEIIEKLVIIVVNAATYHDPKRDKKPKVPGVIDVLTTASTIPLSNYTYDTIQLVKHRVDEFNEAVALRAQCNQIMTANNCPVQLEDNLYKLDLYLSHLTFDSIEDDETRHWFKNLPTSFKLPSETVDKLKDMGKILLQNTKSFKTLLEEIGAE